MKVVYTLDTLHNIIIVPRFTPTNCTFEMVNEYTKEVFNPIIEYYVYNGFLHFRFEFTFSDNDKYTFTLLDENEIIYKGKIIATEQISQDYKLSYNKYEWK